MKLKTELANDSSENRQSEYEQEPRVRVRRSRSPDNAKGQLIKVVTGTGDIPLAATEYQAFDEAGRVTQSQQLVDGIAYGAPMTYAYNLAGGLTEQRYPSGRIVKNTLDRDGNLEMVQSRKNQNTGFHTYANNFTYNAAGAITSMQLGNGSWESASFNLRLQPTQIALGTVAGDANKLELNYEYGNLDGDDIMPGTNNGNLAKQTIRVSDAGQTPGFVARQYYTYDGLNRLKIARESMEPNGGSIQFSWRQHFSYDRYGNKTYVTTGTEPTTTLGTCPATVCNPTISPSDNKITSPGYAFDDAGNTTRDAQDRKFTYDAENKQVKVESVSGQTVTGTVGEYWYDGDGRRIKKSASSSETTIFVYDTNGKLVAEYSTVVASETEAKVAYLTSPY